MLRTVTPDDAEELLNIYAPYVKNTAISFEYDVPSVEEFRERIINTAKKYPYIAAQKDGKILGYAYAGDFYGRKAYEHSAETTVYVKEDSRRLRVGKMLYAELERLLKKQNITNLYACVAYTEEPDEYLTNDSINFHSRLGFKVVGEFKNCGYKFGRWYSVVWLEKIIAEHSPLPEPFVPSLDVGEE